MNRTKFDEESGYWPPDHDGQETAMAFLILVALTWLAGASSGAWSFILTMVAIGGWWAAIQHFSPDEDE